MENELGKMIDEFGNRNETHKSLSKDKDALNKKIKDIMKEKQLEEFSGINFKAKYSKSVSSSFDGDKLVSKLKSLDKSNLLKTVEVVDMEKLENEIYDGQLLASDLDDCTIEKVVYKLLVSKV